jgi:hypothetical protein
MVPSRTPRATAIVALFGIALIAAAGLATAAVASFVLRADGQHETGRGDWI